MGSQSPYDWFGMRSKTIVPGKPWTDVGIPEGLHRHSKCRCYPELERICDSALRLQSLLFQRSEASQWPYPSPQPVSILSPPLFINPQDLPHASKHLTSKGFQSCHMLSSSCTDLWACSLVETHCQLAEAAKHKRTPEPPRTRPVTPQTSTSPCDETPS